MINNTDFKILLGTFDYSRLICICHLLTDQYISECKDILRDTELLNILVLFLLVKKGSILCYIALFIRHDCWYCGIVNFFLFNLGHPLYGVSLSHDIGYFLERINYSLVVFIYS